MGNRTYLTVLVSTALLATPLPGQSDERRRAARRLEPPPAVSPGGIDRPVEIEQRCPTFSWGLLEEIDGYELVIYELEADDRSHTEAALHLRQRLPAGVSVWTPEAARCLTPGNRYAWLVRSLTVDAEGPWSQPRLFRVAAPSRTEVELALDVLRGYLTADVTHEAVGEGHIARELRPNEPSSLSGRKARSITTAGVPGPDAVAIRGNLADTNGVTFGLYGISASVDAGAAGVVGQSTASSGATTGVLGAVDSSAGVAGAFDNMAGGQILSGLNNGLEVFAVDGAGAVTANSFTGDGSAVTSVDADLLDGNAASDFAASVHVHSGADVTSGAVGEAFIDGAIARDAEVLPTVLAGDGTGSGLDSDLLDGMDSATFMPAGTDQWVDETGDSMTGDLSTSGDYLWSAPRTFFRMIPATVFVAGTNDYAPSRIWNKFDQALAVSVAGTFPNTTVFKAALDLPDGATIQNFTMYYYDNDPSAELTVGVFAMRRSLAGAGVSFVTGTTLNATTSGSSTAIQSTSVPAVSSLAEVDNDQFMYDLHLGFTLPTAASFDLRFYGVGVEYTVDGPST